MKVKQVYLRPEHPNAYKNLSGDGLTPSFYMVKPTGNYEERLCYQVTYNDGVVDYTPCGQNASGCLIYSK